MIDELLKVMALFLMVEIAYLGLQILRLCQEVWPLFPRCRRLMELAMNNYDVRQSLLDLKKKEKEFYDQCRLSKQSVDFRLTAAEQKDQSHNNSEDQPDVKL